MAVLHKELQRVPTRTSRVGPRRPPRGRRRPGRAEAARAAGWSADAGDGGGSGGGRVALVVVGPGDELVGSEGEGAGSAPPGLVRGAALGVDELAVEEE